MRVCGSMGRALAALTFVAVLGLGETACAYASEPGVLEIPMDEAVRAPVKLTLALGHVILIRAGTPPRVESVGDPSIVHAITREGDVLLVPLRQGRTSITIGFGGPSSVLFDVTVGADAGVRSVVLTPGSPVASGKSPGGTSPAPPPLASPAAPDARVSAPPGVRVTVVPTAVGATLFVSYVFQNLTGHALRADPHDLEIAGTRGATTVRQMDIGEPGVIAPASAETGVIALTPASPAVRLTWVLRGDDGAVLSV